MNRVARIGYESVKRLLEAKGWSCRQIDGKACARMECTKKDHLPVKIQVRTAHMKGDHFVENEYPFIVADSPHNGLTENLENQINMPHALVPLRSSDSSVEGHYPIPAADVRSLAAAKFKVKNLGVSQPVCLHLTQLPPYHERWDLIGID